MTDLSHVAMGSGAEFDMIRRLLAEWGSRAHGIGDDAAILDIPSGERLVVSMDASVERVHFRREWLSAEEIGARAAAAALSDLAAMAAMPSGLLLALALPERWRGDVAALARGVGAVATAAQCPIVGGNITASDALSLTITVLGHSARPLRRSGAELGDIIFVTGLLGGPGAALRALLRGDIPAAEQRMRFAMPQPRLREARWLADHGAHAAIDISDGLLGDAGHLARASGVSLELDADALPCMPAVSAMEAATSGEEYELLVAMPPGVQLDARAFEGMFGVRLTQIGVVAVMGHEPVTMRGAQVSGLGSHDHLA